MVNIDELEMSRRVIVEMTRLGSYAKENAADLEYEVKFFFPFFFLIQVK